MRSLLSTLAVAAVLLPAAAYNLRAPAAGPELATVTSEVDAPPQWPSVAPYDEQLPVPVEALDLPRESWCEPVDPLTCIDDSGCPPTPFGTPRVCVSPWYAKQRDARVCAIRFPARDVQRWRSARLRILVDEICKRRDGCDPEALHDYLSILAQRETSWRPYKRHRLNPDVESSALAFSRRRDVFAASPAVDQPWRWTTVGLYGQNSALWLDRWDAASIPEALCGEVEATLVHLRAARERLERLERGVVCDGSESHGTARGDAPSWFDLSLVNSGSEACPGTTEKAKRLQVRFESSARQRGLDAYAPVGVRMLGRPVNRAEQDRFAARVRAKMNAEFPPPE